MAASLRNEGQQVIMGEIGQLRWLTLVDVGEDTALGDCDVAEELVQFFVVADGELEMTWDDTGLLVVAGGIASQLEDLGC